MLVTRTLFYFSFLLASLGGVLFYSHQSQVYWLLLAVAFWQAVYLSRDYPAALPSLGIISFTALGVMLSSLLQSDIVILALYISFITFVTFYIGLQRVQFSRAMFFSNSLIVLSACLPISWDEALARSAWILVGGFLSVMAFIACYSSKVRAKLDLEACIVSLGELASTVLITLVVQDSIEKKYDYEKTLHGKRSYFLSMLVRLKRYKHDASTVVLSHALEQAFGIIQSLQLLSLRVEDVTTFQVISKECYGLAESIALQCHVLVQRLYNQDHSLTKDDLFQDYIYQIEEIYQTALQVVAPDPVVFLLCIAELKEWHSVIKKMSLIVNTMHVRGMK